MKTTHGMILATMASLLVGVLLWLSTENEDAIIPKAQTSATTQQVEPNSVGQPHVAETPPKVDISFSSEGFQARVAREVGKLQKLTDTKATAFLDACGRTPSNLAALYYQTSDPKWLEEALNLHPDSPLLLIAVLGDSTITDEHKAAALEKLKTVDANNPVPWLFDAASHFRANRSKEGLEAIEAAVSRPGFYDYRREVAKSQAGLMEFLGMDSLVAAAAAGGPTPTLASIGDCSDHLSKLQSSSDGTVSLETKIQANELLFRLGEMYTTPIGGRELINRLTGYALQIRALTSIPGGGQASYTSIPPDQKLAELKKEKDFVGTLAKNINQRTMSNVEMNEFQKIVADSGEWNAMLWLHERSKK